MKRYSAITALLILAVCGCSSKASNPLIAQQSSTRAYTGTASVGDFMSLTLDADAHTLAYTNYSNGDSATVSYTVNSDGGYTLADPTGNLLSAYEVPNFVLLIQAAKTGPNHDQMALVTAVQRRPISVSTLGGHDYNYMQLRTAAGGLEVGSANIDLLGYASTSSYWPYGAMNQSSPFNNGGVSTDSFQVDPSGTFMRLPGDQGGYDYIFGTPNGVFAVDTPNGAILGLAKASSKDFDPLNAGTYNSIYYEKVGASTGMGNVESGTPSLGKGTVTVSAGGVVTIADVAGTALATGTLTPIEDTPYLYGPNEISDPCHGLFTIRLTAGNIQQDIFVTFLSGAVLFSSFAADPTNPGGTYDYFYGAALK